MKLWIRLDAGTPRDPKITELARALGVHRAEAFGLAASVWCVMAEHAVDGNLTAIADEDLEAWAYWQGKRGRFATAFRATFVADDGTVGGWSERQGALLERMERDRARHRKTPGDSPEPPRKLRGNSTEPPRSPRGNSTSTVRNGTEQKIKSSSGAGAPANNWVDAARQILLGVGVFTHGRIGKALGPVVQQYGWPETEPGLRDYVAAMKGKKATPEWFAQESGTWVVGAREPFADECGVPTARTDRILGVAS